MAEKNKKTRHLVDLRTVYELIALTNNVVDKAIITHILSSSMKYEELRRLKVSDLLNACEDAFMDFEDNDSLRVLLRKNPFLITPVWHFEKVNKTKNKCCITFGSGESLFYIFVHLKERLNNFEITNGDYLFANENNKQLSNSHASDMLRKTSKKLFGKNTDLYIDVGDLRHYFDDTCISFLQLSDKDNKKLIKLFKNGVSEKQYNKYLSDITKIKGYYQKLLKYFTAKDFEHAGSRAYSSDSDFNRFFIQEINEANSKEPMNESALIYICEKYLDSKFDDEYSDDEKEVMKNNYIRYAKEDNKNCFFNDSKDYLDELWEKTFIQHVLDKNKKINIKITPKTVDKKVDELVNTLNEYEDFEELDINNMVMIFKDILLSMLNNEKSINITSAHVTEMIYECLLYQK